MQVDECKTNFQMHLDIFTKLGKFARTIANAFESIHLFIHSLVGNVCTKLW